MAIKKKIVAELPLGEVSAPDILTDDSAPEAKIPKDRQASKITNIEMVKSQSIERLQSAFDAVVKEINSIEDLKRKTKEELELEKRQSKQQVEQDNLTLLLSERKRRAEFDEKLEKDIRQFEDETKKKKEELKTAEEILGRKSVEFDALKAQAESFPIKLGKAVEESRKQVSVELKKDFDNERVLLTQKYQSEMKLLEQQIISLQNQNKLQEKEMFSLRIEKTKAIEQIKDLAVAVIKGNEKENDARQQIEQKSI